MTQARIKQPLRETHTQHVDRQLNADNFTEPCCMLEHKLQKKPQPASWLCRKNRRVRKMQAKQTQIKHAFRLKSTPIHWVEQAHAYLRFEREFDLRFKSYWESGHLMGPHKIRYPNLIINGFIYIKN